MDALGHVYKTGSEEEPSIPVRAHRGMITATVLDADGRPEEQTFSVRELHSVTFPEELSLPEWKPATVAPRTRRWGHYADMVQAEVGVSVPRRD